VRDIYLLAASAEEFCNLQRRKELNKRMLTIATLALLCFGSLVFGQNSNSSTTMPMNMSNRNMSGMHRRNRHRKHRRHRRHMKMGNMKMHNMNANKG
jgi:hypothetical protein